MWKIGKEIDQDHVKYFLYESRDPAVCMDLHVLYKQLFLYLCVFFLLLSADMSPGSETVYD